MTLWLSQSDTLCSIRILVKRSSTKTESAMAAAKPRLGISAIEHLGHRAGASLANSRQFGIGSHIGSVLPAAFALRSVSAFDRHWRRIAIHELHLRHDKQRRKRALVPGQQLVLRVSRPDLHLGLQPRADELGLPRRLEVLHDVLARFAQDGTERLEFFA